LSHRISLLLIFFGLVASSSAQSNFNRYTYSVGGGFGIGRGYVGSFVGESFQGTVGGGINFTRMFSADAEYMYYNLDLRPSVAQEPGLADATGRLQSISLDGIVNVPRHIGKWGLYGIFGVGFDIRSVSVPHSQLLANGTVCQPPYSRWWGINCFDFNPASPPTVTGQQTLSAYTRVAGSYNYGGGITYHMESWHHAKIFLEGRYHKAYQADGETIVLPITLGLRW
jgi:outer membrane protein with beta-barrel domain